MEEKNFEGKSIIWRELEVLDMPLILIDGGYFVGRFEKHWSRYSKKKNMRYWWNKGKERHITKDELMANLKRILSYDIGYLNMRIQEMMFPRKVVVCYDGIYGRRTRGSRYPEYKMNRRGDVKSDKHKGIDVRKRIKQCGYDPHNIQEYWSYEYDELMEADDIIARICYDCPTDDEIIVMTKDKDLFQLMVLPNVKIHDFTKFYTVDDFKEEFGIEPHQYLDFKALAGDSSDNIPGVKGIGLKTASKLLQKYGTIEEIPYDIISEDKREEINLWKRISKIPYHIT